ncbi:hypothetical protein FHU36_001019 [Nonomuraea muscovyensis]|uniref:Uncharacterized protein n=1 Tax=Nonomuraea muscovyensis TaxID=1124761 RepID=A0A7X0EX66_9ACTN|nr:hypothetical protein [Nonomuraea muscovyensis]MBB6344510.1 hypothetical protein [Nonomuraea muscovyensis]
MVSVRLVGGGEQAGAGRSVHVFTDKGELEAEAPQRGLTAVRRGRLTSEAELAQRPY